MFICENVDDMWMWMRGCVISNGFWPLFWPETLKKLRHPFKETVRGRGILESYYADFAELSEAEQTE